MAGWARGLASLRAAVVGSGPAGMYTVQRLLKQYGNDVAVDVLDRLPTPFGLVRSGVAADHADTKNVTNQFTRLLGDERVRFFGNVNVGGDVSLPELQELYDAVVLTYGTEADKRLGITGEELPGVLSAREFVWWFNGHPDCADLPVDLSRTRSVAVLGLGNVALDCARILLQSPTGPLAATDISAAAHQELRRSAVEEVHIVGRRGAVQAQFTGIELKELLFTIPGIATAIPPEALALTAADEAEMAAERRKKRCVGLLRDKAAQNLGENQGERSLRFHFLRSPVEVVAGSDGRAAALRMERNVLTGGGDGAEQRPRGTGEFEELPVDLVLTCIGYRALPLEGVPFDERRGVIPNSRGRVDGVAGVYAGGWVARGPSGKIGTNLADANDVVDAIVEDCNNAVISPGDKQGDLAELLRQRGVAVVDFQAWQRIDEAEVREGEATGKVRRKFDRVDDMLRVASGLL